MKRNQTIVKALTALVIAFGVQNTVSAQFGGLLNRAKAKAKYKIESKVDNAVDRAIDKATDKAEDTVKGKGKKKEQEQDNNQSSENSNDNSTQQQTQKPGQTDQATQDYINQLQTQYNDEHSGDFEQKSDGSYWIWLSSGYGTHVYDDQPQLMGKYYPKDRKIWLQSETFTIADDGKVYDSKGQWRAIIQKNRIVSCNAEAINIVEHEKYLDLKIGNKVIGQVTSDGRVIMGGDAYAATGPIDMRVLAFFCFGIQFSNEELLALVAKREKAVVDQEAFDQANAEFGEFTGRVSRMAVRANVEKNGMSGKMDARDYYKYEQTNHLDRGCHWVWLDNIRVCGWNPENNRLLDRDYNWLGTFSGGVLYDRFGVKYGSVQGGIVKNRHGQVVGKAVKGAFKGTYLGGKGKDFNYKLVDASGNQVGLVQTNASPDLVAVWAFCMFAKK
ncbi:MAG: hypothetical protein J6I37_03910 [Prevotella sp.]|nr:hypothetical protein [Prevotella sp.]